MLLSVVVPCYNEENNLRPLCAACREALEGVAEYELVFVNDGSTDGTWQQLQALYAELPGSIQLIDLSRNFGKEAAMLAGLRRARGELT